jgi:imidazolonepropionase-like amidohydrolase
MKFILHSFLFLFLLGSVSAQNRSILIRASKMYDSENNSFSTNQQILITGNKIVKVGKNIKAPKGTKVIELKNATLTPGLIDAHSHLLFSQGQSKLSMEEASAMPAASRIEEGIGFGKELLQAGFTTVRDLGNSGNTSIFN